jgi:hypothetical protein
MYELKPQILIAQRSRPIVHELPVSLIPKAGGSYGVPGD